MEGRRPKSCWSNKELRFFGKRKDESQRFHVYRINYTFLIQVISVEQYTKKQWELTAEGKSVAANGSHEAVVYNAVPNEGISQPELMVISYYIIFCCIAYSHELIFYRKKPLMLRWASAKPCQLAGL
jgi:hypothetical protein